MKNLLSQYKFTRSLTINISSSIDSIFIKDFVEGYKELLIEKEKKIIENDDVFLKETRHLRFVILSKEYNKEDGFDLLFISYLTLLKSDFPNIIIHFEFPNFVEGSSLNAFIYQLAHHRIHLLINSKIEVFKIFKNGLEFSYNRIVQSDSYIPPLVINKESLKQLFSSKNDLNNFLARNIYLIKTLKNDEIIAKEVRDQTFKRIQDSHSDIIGQPTNWSFSDLSNLYFFKALYDLYVLRYFINDINNKKSNYQIGQVIIHSRDDKTSTKRFKDRVYSSLRSNGFFNFSDVEIYFFALVIENSELFKMPTTLKQMHSKIMNLLDEREVKRVENFETNKIHEKYLKTKFIDIYVENLIRIINYTKEVVYGLEELAKNIVEHSNSNDNGYGIISGRIYSLNKVKLLKKDVSVEWLKKFNTSHKYIDINVIDSGKESVIDVYKETLKKEKENIILKTDDDRLAITLSEEYTKDIDLLDNYKINNLFNYEFSLKLMHQINRTKARLGLLIFSQTILHEKEAFINLVSTNLHEKDDVGYQIYIDNDKIIEKQNRDYLPLGTNLNFIIPVNEKFTIDKTPLDANSSYFGSTSSVFKELYDYELGKTSDAKFKIIELDIDINLFGYDKYMKLDVIKSEIDKITNENNLILIDASKFKSVIENSSDWVRLLANIQFGSIYTKDLIVLNIDPKLYEEIIDILKIFSNLNDNSIGFWKDDRYILFYLPITNAKGNVFWFNSLIYSKSFDEFLKINEEIGLYHHNLAKMTDSPKKKQIDIDYNSIQSKLFSSSKKLLNFELIIKNNNGITLFEETLKSLLNVEILALEK